MQRNRQKQKAAAVRIAVKSPINRLLSKMSKFKIGILGNRNETYPPHYRMDEALNDLRDTFDFSVEWIPTETLEVEVTAVLKSCQGIIAGSGPYQSKTGVINGIRYTRENNIPFLGTCSGFGYAVLEFGQRLFRLQQVHHPYEGIELKSDESFLQPLKFCSAEMHTIAFTPVTGTLTDRLYQQADNVEEESHCTYGVNLQMMNAFEKAGLTVGAYDRENEPKMMEYRPNDFFIITLFLPQLKSLPQRPHPLLLAFLTAASVIRPNA
jgi:CTP synthase (UTP-ammonia lyase)